MLRIKNKFLTAIICILNLRFWRSILVVFLAINLALPPVLAQIAPGLPYSSVQVNVPCPMGIQVNSFNGNLYYSRTDLVIPGRGLSLTIGMAYNSGQSDIDNGFGYGWQFSYNLYYEEDGDDVLIYRGDGRVDKYLWGGSTFGKPQGVRDTLEEYATGKYRLTSPQGIKTFFDNATHKHVTSIQEPNGNTLTFTYSGVQLTTITDTSGRQLNLTYSGGRLTTITDPNTTPNRTIEFQYDGIGNLTSITDLGGNATTYGYSGHMLTSVTDPRGETATITYATPGTVSAVTNVSTSTTSKSFDYALGSRTTMVTDVVDGGDQVTEYVYDANDRISSIVDGLGHSVSMTWDSRANLTSYIDENGHTTSYTYDANDNVLTVTDPLGHVTTYTYDSTYNKVTSIQDANNHTSTYQYDANGNLVKIIDALNKETTLTYDANGNLTSETDANNHTTTYGYNSYGDLTSVVDALSHTISFTYDNVGNMLSMTDANSNTTTYTHDALDRLTTVTNALSQQTTFAYDANGNQTSVTDAESNTTTYTYDALNRLTRVTDALSHQTNYTYDQMDNLKTIVDAESHTTTFTYDAANRLTSEADPLSHTTSYSYDSASNLTSRTDANGDTTTYTYDDTNQLTAIDYPGSNDVTYSNDNVGNVTGMSNANASVSYSYDAADRVTNVSVTAGALNKSVSYTYDNVGNRATMIDLDSGVTTYTYDNADRLTSLVNPASQTTSYIYDDADRLTRKDYQNGTYALYTYDDANQLLSVTNKNSSGTTLSSYTYQHDNAGNRTRMTEASGDQTDYTYDDLYRLTGVTYPDTTTATYTYDNVGNRTQLVDSGGTTNYTYDNADRLLSAGTTTYVWDNNGNQTSKVEGGNTMSYTYDYENRLTGITFPDSTTNSFTYYPDGRRLSATNKAGTTTYYFYDGFNALVETDSSRTTVARYTSGLGIDEWINMDRGGSSYTYHHDGLGSIVGLNDASETVVAAYQYYPFGAIKSQTGSIVNTYRFTGREYDIESNLYFYRARYYDAGTGRFTTKDSFPGVLQYPLSLNKYGYVLNNPINFIDPHGWIFRKIIDVFEKIIRRWDPRDLPTSTSGPRGCGGGGNNGGSPGNGGGGPGQTIIELLSFTTEAGMGSVTLTWQTASEIDNAGFNLYRSTAEDDAYTKINKWLIPAKGESNDGATYSYQDLDVVSGKTYYYELEDIDLCGLSTFHGSVSITVGARGIVPTFPEDGAILRGYPPPTFEWEDAGFDKFKLQFSNRPDFKEGVITLPKWITDNSYTLDRREWRWIWLALRQQGKTIYWRVYGQDEAGNSLISEVNSFR